MSDFNYMLDKVADQQIRERIATARQAQLHGRNRPRGRHALAHHLHALAAKIDQ